MTKFKSFKDFYPFYLSEHQKRANRILHFLGTLTGLAFILRGLFIQEYIWILYALVLGYGCAWIGHFFIEKNRPATFKYPFYSFMADWRFFFDVLTAKQKL